MQAGSVLRIISIFEWARFLSMAITYCHILAVRIACLLVTLFPFPDFPDVFCHRKISLNTIHARHRAEVRGSHTNRFLDATGCTHSTILFPQMEKSSKAFLAALKLAYTPSVKSCIICTRENATIRRAMDNDLVGVCASRAGRQSVCH